MSEFTERNKQWAQGLAYAMLAELRDAPDSIALQAAALLKGMLVERWKARDVKHSRRTKGMD